MVPLESTVATLGLEEVQETAAREVAGVKLTDSRVVAPRFRNTESVDSAIFVTGLLEEVVSVQNCSAIQPA